MKLTEAQIETAFKDNAENLESILVFDEDGIQISKYYGYVKYTGYTVDPNGLKQINLIGSEDFKVDKLKELSKKVTETEESISQTADDIINTQLALCDVYELLASVQSVTDNTAEQSGEV